MYDPSLAETQGTVGMIVFLAAIAFTGLFIFDAVKKRSFKDIRKLYLWGTVVGWLLFALIWLWTLQQTIMPLYNLQ